MTISVENEEKILNDFVKQHKKNYQEAVIEILKNNTKSLIDEDISSLIKDPPLDSMDTIKTKLLFLAKKSNVVLKSDEMKILISNYRNNLLNTLDSIRDIRNNDLIDKILNFNSERKTEIIEIKISDLEKNNKLIKKELKKSINDSVKKYLINGFDKMYDDNIDDEKKIEIKQDFSKYMKNTYQKQLLDNISIKIMVKDRTLINGVIEQGERYLFMNENSYILNEKSTIK